MSKYKELTQQNVLEARQYIAKYWEQLVTQNKEDKESLLALPNPYVVPANGQGKDFDFDEMYYWDTYFVIQGLLGVDGTKDLLEGMVENLVFMYERFKIIPNASRTYLTSRSQPPLLTSMIWDTYSSYGLERSWLKRRLEVAEQEYWHVWHGTKKPFQQLVYQDLSRYYDPSHIHDLAEAESGWDMTTRFDRRALDFLPVDLNALLYKYETDFAHYYDMTADRDKLDEWGERSERRKEVMNELMWDESSGLYYDYDYKNEHRGDVMSLATYFPMWAGMVNEEQAARLVDNLRRFEYEGGLAATAGAHRPKKQPVPTQWVYPNGWAPLHFIVVQALERYGYTQDARRIAMKWLQTNLSWFNREGEFIEKYNVAHTSEPPINGLYPTMSGFAWTNAVFVRFCRDYIDD